MKRTRQVVLLLFVAIVAMSWQTSLRAQAVARVGVVVSDLTEAEGHALGLPDRGVFVADVRNDTSAARAGILARDVIFELDGGPIHGLDDFICRVSRKQPGDFVRFQILRSLKPLAITVSLGTWPEGVFVISAFAGGMWCRGCAARHDIVQDGRSRWRYLTLMTRKSS